MAWRLVLGAFVVLLPFALLLDLHPGRERSDARGRPLRREWSVRPDRGTRAGEHR